MKDHHNHNHDIKSPNNEKILIVSIIINLLFVAFELFMGFMENSLSLLSDAGHNFGDVFSLLLVLFATYLAKMKPNNKYTYGYKKTTILISLINAMILLVAVGAIIVESVYKFKHPLEINGITISWVGGLGIIINGLTVFLLTKGSKNDINMKGAFLHMVADTLVSVGVVVAGVVINITHYNIIDPLISVVIAIVILVSTWGLLISSIRLSLDGIPQNINIEEIKQLISQEKGVIDYHHLHIWAISTTENALTVHVVVENMDEIDKIKQEIKHKLIHKSITHSTIEIEKKGSKCSDFFCLEVENNK